MKVAVIGSGIAGLTAARELAELGHDPVIFERRDRPALLAHTAEFTLDGESYSIDTLLIWKTYHLELVRLLDKLGLSLDVFPMHTVSFSREGKAAPYARYKSRQLGALGRNLTLPSGRSALETLEISSYWLLKWMRALVKRRHVDAETSIGDFFASDSEDHYRKLIYPWLCGCFGFVPADVVARTPLRSMLEFQMPTLPHSPQRVHGGMKALAGRLLEGSELRLEHEVSEVVPLEEGHAGLRVRGECPGSRFAETFDHVVLGVSPTAMPRLIRGLSSREQEIWSSFEQSPVTLYVHTDESLMPSDRQDWATVNYRLRDDESGPIEETVWSNDAVDIAGGAQVFFSWNPVVPPAAESVLYKTHLIRVVPSVEVQGFLRLEIPEFQGQRHLWYCGTWAIPGRGSYLEEGVRSAQAVAVQLHDSSAISRAA